MNPRSYLFVPGDSARKIDKAAASSADAIILDLEDSVAPSRKAQALRTTAEFLENRPIPNSGSAAYQAIWVRVNSTDSTSILGELAALPLAAVAGIVHPKLASHAQLERMGHWLDALETSAGNIDKPTGIIGIITETAGAVVGEQAATLARGHARLRGYSWGVEDLSAALGRPPLPGQTSASETLAQTMQRHCRMMAAAADVDAIDGISANFRDLDALAGECDYARELGYTAKLAIHPAQLDTIHAGLAPSAEAVAWARQVRALVDENPDAASFQLDGRMVDAPHFEVALQILAQARTKR